MDTSPCSGNETAKEGEDEAGAEGVGVGIEEVIERRIADFELVG